MTPHRAFRLGWLAIEAIVVGLAVFILTFLFFGVRASASATSLLVALEFFALPMIILLLTSYLLPATKFRDKEGRDLVGTALFFVLSFGAYLIGVMILVLPYLFSASLVD
jgi:hypothetical protein